MSQSQKPKKPMKKSFTSKKTPKKPASTGSKIFRGPE